MRILQQLEKRENPEIIDLASYLVDVEKDIEKESTIASIAGTPIFTAGNLSALTGKAKSRKTFCAAIFTASQLCGQCHRIKADRAGTALYIDTEQSLFHTQLLAKRILLLSGHESHLNNPNLIVYALRALSAEQRKEALIEAIKLHKPTFVVIDGIRDLILDFNDIKSSAELVNLLMRLSSDYSCHILSVLHQNKADNNMRGHAGSELLNKSESVFEVTTLDNTTQVKVIATRGLPPEDFYFQIEAGLPVECGQPTKSDVSLDMKKDCMRRVLGQSAMKYVPLVTAYQEASGKGERTSKVHISELMAAGDISKDTAGFYRLERTKTIDTNGDLPY